MILTFKVFKEKIESGEKEHTIRLYSDSQFNRAANTYLNMKLFQLYWHNPRNGGKLIKERIPWCLPIKIKWIRDTERRVYVKNVATGEILNNEDLARKDGFNSWEEMVNWFYNEYGESLFEKYFMILWWVP
jgi:hypothetical protein